MHPRRVRARTTAAVVLAITAACSGPAAVGEPDAVAAIAPDPRCAAPGCLRRATKVGDYTRAWLMPLVDPRVTIENGYAVWTIEYVTGDRTSLATVTIPIDVAAPAAGFAIVANNHGTTGLDDACALADTAYGAGLAGLFGARGMIGVAPDYPGLGTAGLHPYLVRDVEGKAVLDALRAARALARWQAVPISGRFAAVGMSQGGHATLAAAMLHGSYAAELDVRGFAVAAPASVFEEHWRAGIGFDGPHVPYHAMLVGAWMQHYGYSGPSPWAAGQAERVAAALAERCIVAMNGAGALSDAIGPERMATFSPEFLDAYRTGTWGAYGAFAVAFAANRIRPYAQTAPVTIYQGDADPVVLESATAELVRSLRDGGVTLDYEVVPGGTHIDVAFGYLAAYEARTDASIAWVRARLE